MLVGLVGRVRLVGQVAERAPGLLQARVGHPLFRYTIGSAAAGTLDFIVHTRGWRDL